MFARVLGIFFSEVFAFFRDVDIVVEVGTEGLGEGRLGETGGVGGGLGAQLGEVEV